MGEAHAEPFWNADASERNLEHTPSIVVELGGKMRSLPGWVVGVHWEGKGAG
jgi:hypothetical protein